MQSELKLRDPFMDNAKFLLIFLMVLGHFAFESRENLYMMGICNSIYAFHMPLFIIISGYFSQRIHSQRKSEITQLLIPYLLFELIHFLYTQSSGLGKGHLQFTVPTYQNWYLLSLFSWRLIIPYFRFIDKKTALPLVIVCSLGAGYIQHFGDFLGLYRTVYLLPFFVFGYYLNDFKKYVILYRKYQPVFVSLFVIILSGIFLFSTSSDLNAARVNYAFIPNFGYSDGSLDLIARALALLLGFILSFLFLFLIPDKTTFYTAQGKNTMTVYLVHIFLVWPLLQLGEDWSIGIQITAYLLMSIGITFLFSSRSVASVLKIFTNPYFYLSKKKIKIPHEQI